MKRLALVALLLGLAGCASSEASPEPTTSTSPAPPTSMRVSPPAKKALPPRTSVSATPRPEPTLTPVKTTTPAEPTILPDNLQKYMLRLENIRPDLSSNESAAIKHARAVCARVAANDAYFDLLTFTRREFGKDADKPLTESTAASVYEVVRDELCPQ